MINDPDKKTVIFEPEGRGPFSPGPFPRPLLALIFLAGFAVARQQGGWEPILTYDTVNDAKFVSACLEGGCAFSGMGTSIGFIRHGANYLHLKTLAVVLGLNETQVHFILQVLHGLGAALTCEATSLVAGPIAGAMAGPIYLYLANNSDLEMRDTYNHRMFPFLGALLLALLVKASHKRSPLLFLLCGCVAAITTNIHVGAFTSIFAVAMVAKMVGYVHSLLVLFASSTVCFLTSPQAWIANVLGLSGAKLGVFEPEITRLLSSRPTPVAAVVVTCLWMMALLLCKATRQNAFGPWLLVAVRLGVLGLSLVTGSVVSDDKYLLDVLPSVALLLASSPSLLPSKWLRISLFPRPAGRLAPYAFIMVAFFQGLKDRDWSNDLFHVTPSEIMKLKAYLFERLGLSSAKAATAIRHFRGSFLIEAMFPRGLPRDTRDVEPSNALYFVVKAPIGMVEPLSQYVLDSDEHTALLVIPVDSWLDYRDFTVCVSYPEGGEECQRSKYDAFSISSGSMPGFPVLDMPGKRFVIRVTFNVSVPPSRGYEAARTIYMPSFPDLCKGRVVSVSGLEAIVSEAKDLLELFSTSGPQRGTLTLEWRIGEEGCRGYAYKGHLPFFMEMDQQTADLLIPIVEKVAKMWRPK